MAAAVYRVEAELDGRFWHIRVPEVGRSTQARSLREIEPMARDLIAIMEEVPGDSLRLDIHVTLPQDVQQELERSAELRDRAARQQAEASRLMRDAACRLRERGLSLRDVGKALGMSHQRAHQLVDEAREPADA